MLTSLLVGLSLVTAPHGGSFIHTHPLARDMGGYMPVGIAAPSSADAGDTITVSVAIGSPQIGNVNMAVSSTQSSEFSALPSQLTIPAGYTSGSIQATFADSASGNVQITVSNAAGKQTATITVYSDSLHHRVARLKLR